MKLTKKEVIKELRKELEKAQQVANDNADIGRILEKENELLKASNNELSTKIEEKWNIENDYERLSSEYNVLFNSFNELEKENKLLLERLANETKRLNSQKKLHYKYTERLRSEIKEYKSFEGNVTFPLIDDKVKGLEKENKELKDAFKLLEMAHAGLNTNYETLFNKNIESKKDLEISQAHCRKLAKQNNGIDTAEGNDSFSISLCADEDFTVTLMSNSDGYSFNYFNNKTQEGKGVIFTKSNTIKITKEDFAKIEKYFHEGEKEAQ